MHPVLDKLNEQLFGNEKLTESKSGFNSITRLRSDKADLNLPIAKNTVPRL